MDLGWLDAGWAAVIIAAIGGIIGSVWAVYTHFRASKVKILNPEVIKAYGFVWKCLCKYHETLINGESPPTKNELVFPEGPVLPVEVQSKFLHLEERHKILVKEYFLEYHDFTLMYGILVQRFREKIDADDDESSKSYIEHKNAFRNEIQKYTQAPRNLFQKIGREFTPCVRE